MLLAALAHKPFEVLEIELAGIDRNPVRLRPCDDRVSTEYTAQTRYIALKNVGCGGRRRGSPELVDQQIARDWLVGTNQECGQKRALPWPTELEGLSSIRNLEWPEDAKLKPWPLSHRREPNTSYARCPLALPGRKFPAQDLAALYDRFVPSACTRRGPASFAPFVIPRDGAPGDLDVR